MRPNHSIEDLLGSRSRIAVLRELWGVSVPLNASQIAARVHLTRPAVAAVLRDLGEAGIVSSSSAGRANVHISGVRTSTFSAASTRSSRQSRNSATFSWTI
jgi:DNA-binding transcriptional ArsR family regulator